MIEAEAVGIAVNARRGSGERRLVFVVGGHVECTVDGCIDPRPASLVLRICRCSAPAELSEHVGFDGTAASRSHFEDPSVDQARGHSRLRAEGQRELHVAVVGLGRSIRLVLRR